MMLAPAVAKSATSESTGDTIRCTSIGAVTPALAQRLADQWADGEIRHVVIVHDVEVNPIRARGEHRIHLLAEAGEISGQESMVR